MMTPWFVFFFDLMNETEIWLWNASAVSAGMETHQLQCYIFELRKNWINQICRAARPLNFLSMIEIDAEQLVALLGPVTL